MNEKNVCNFLVNGKGKNSALLFFSFFFGGFVITALNAVLSAVITAASIKKFRYIYFFQIIFFIFFR